MVWRGVLARRGKSYPVLQKPLPRSRVLPYSYNAPRSSELAFEFAQGKKILLTTPNDCNSTQLTCPSVSTYTTPINRKL